MVGRIPSAIVRAANNIVINVPSAEFSGISNPKYQGAFGYHHSRDHLAVYNPNDPSMKHPLDKLGASDACSALDIKLSPSMMRLVTKRLIDACRNNDPFARGIAEVGGTLNSTSTIAWDEKDQRLEYGWDSTHLWHIHVSGWRKYADDEAAWMDIARLFAGQTGGDDDMPNLATPMPEPTDDWFTKYPPEMGVPDNWTPSYGYVVWDTHLKANQSASQSRKALLEAQKQTLILQGQSAALERIATAVEALAAPPPPPPEPELVLGPPLYGVDLNAWRGDVDWPALAAWRNGDHRMAFATLKASHGAADAPPGVDAHWAREAPEMAASGIPLVGGCHRLTLDAPVADQVSKFLSAMDVIGGYAGRLVQLDCEAADQATIVAWMAEWNARTDHYPVLGYLPDWRESQWANSNLNEYGYGGWWASEYVEGQGDPVGLATLITPEHWHAHDGVEPTILQYSSKGVVPGVEGTCDVNLFRGTLAELRELATRPGDG